jgi:hypothetical protein
MHKNPVPARNGEEFPEHGLRELSKDEVALASGAVGWINVFSHCGDLQNVDPYTGRCRGLLPPFNGDLRGYTS